MADKINTNFDEVKGSFCSLYSSSQKNKTIKHFAGTVCPSCSRFLDPGVSHLYNSRFWMCIKVWHLFYYTWLLNHNINNTCHYKWQPDCKATNFILISVQNSQTLKLTGDIPRARITLVADRCLLKWRCEKKNTCIKFQQGRPR